jgi:hypothetical protein
LAADTIDSYARGNGLPSLSSAIPDAVIGAAQAYGPQVAAKWLGAFAKTTVPHTSPITGQFVPGVKGSGIMPWAARTAGEVANEVSGAVEKASPETIGRAVASVATDAKTTATLVRYGVSKEDFGLMKDAISNGFSPYGAAKSVASNPAQLQKLLSAWMALKP